MHPSSRAVSRCKFCNSSAWKLISSSPFHLQLFGETHPKKKENRNETLQVCKLPYFKHGKWTGDKENIIYVEREMTQSTHPAVTSAQMEKQPDLVSEWGSKWAPETRCTDGFCCSCRCVKKGTSGEASAVDAGLCDQEETPSRAQVCFLACPKDCVTSAWGPWSSCSLVRRKNRSSLYLFFFFILNTRDLKSNNEMFRRRRLLIKNLGRHLWW